MKINHIKNIGDFFNMINSCKGEVSLISADGDKIVLTSKLSRFVVTALNESQLLGELEIIASEREDIEKIVDYLIKQ